MARDTAGNDALTDDDIDDEPADGAAIDAFDDDFDDAAAAAIADDAPSGDPDDDVIEGDADLLDDGSDEGAEPAAGAPAKGVDRGDGRDATGKFATKAEQDAADAKAADAKAAAAKTGEPAKPVDGTAPADGAATAPVAEPKWEPLSIRADKAVVPIEEVTITRQNGFHIMAVKDADFARFAQRMSKGVVGEKLWRDLQTGLKDLQAERAAPQPKSDEQIEAEIILATIKDRLGELLEPHELKNLELEVKLAQRDYKDTYATERKQFFDARAEQERAAEAPETEERTQYEGIAKEMLTVFEAHKDKLGDLTEQQLRTAYDNLVRVRRAVYWKEADGWYTNTELIFEQLQAARDGAQAPSASAGHTATTSTTTASPAAGSAKPDKPDAGERFNRAGDTAARPGTTSLKANRGNRPRPARHTREANDGAGRRPVKTAEMVAEDKARAAQRKFMSSDTLDFEDEDDS